MVNNRIPKTIHYIWLGGNQLDNVSKKCMDTWREALPDYEVIKWDDKKCIDIIKSNTYANEAYIHNKYAFVSDYLRLFILYNYGGIYMDTDVEVLKSLDKFLIHSSFSCFENAKQIPTALLGAEKGNPWIYHLLKDYDGRKFLQPDGSYDLTTNVIAISNLSKEFGFKEGNEYQILEGDVHIYPKEYFCPKDTLNKKNDCFTENTHAVHLYNGSWTPKWRRFLSKIKKKFGINPEKLLGYKLYQRVR